jgi:hypothetical protein
MPIAAPEPRNCSNRLARRPAVPLLQNQGFFLSESRASSRQWAAWVLATRFGRLLRYHVLPSGCC